MSWSFDRWNSGPWLVLFVDGRLRGRPRRESALQACVRRFWSVCLSQVPKPILHVELGFDLTFHLAGGPSESNSGMPASFEPRRGSETR